MRLREIRKRGGHTTVSAAKALSVSQPTYNTWELGTREPNIEKILALCQLLDTTPNELLGFPSGASAGDTTHGANSPIIKVNGNHNTIAPPSTSSSPSTPKKKKAKK